MMHTRCKNGQISSPQKTFKYLLLLHGLNRGFSTTPHYGIWCLYPVLEADGVGTTHPRHTQGQFANSNFHLLIQATFWCVSPFNRNPSEHKPNVSKACLLVPSLHWTLTKSPSFSDVVPFCHALESAMWGVG